MPFVMFISQLSVVLSSHILEVYAIQTQIPLIYKYMWLFFFFFSTYLIFLILLKSQGDKLVKRQSFAREPSLDQH